LRQFFSKDVSGNGRNAEMFALVYVHIGKLVLFGWLVTFGLSVLVFGWNCG
jgi:hypothetical protein